MRGAERGAEARLSTWSLSTESRKRVVLPLLGIKFSAPYSALSHHPGNGFYLLHFTFIIAITVSRRNHLDSPLKHRWGCDYHFFFLWCLATVGQFQLQVFYSCQAAPFLVLWLERASFCWAFFVFLSLLAFLGCWHL